MKTRKNMLATRALVSAILFAAFIVLSPKQVTAQEIAIGNVLDSLTNLSHSFAVYELFRLNPLIKDETDTLKPVLFDYHLGHAYGITGTFNSQDNEFRIYANGKKITEIKTSKSWRELFKQLSEPFVEQGYTRPRRFVSVREGTVDKIGEKSIGECFPGSVTYQVPATSKLTALENHIALDYIRVRDSRDLYNTARETYGAYSTYKENDIFFFRNADVPYDLKEIAKPLVYPSYRTMNPTLNYLATGTALAEAGDYGPALNALHAALYTSNKVIASPLERALIRKTAYSEISTINLTGLVGRKNMADLYDFAAQLNDAYVNSDTASMQKQEYYEGVSKISGICVPAESKAKEIRGTKRLGGFLAAASTAGAFASVSPYDNSVSDAMLQQASQTLTQYNAEASATSQLLAEQFEDIDERIHSETFIVGDDAITEIGKPLVALEVAYYLARYPNIVRSALMSYATDKPRLKTLLDQFYATSNDRQQLLFEVVKQVAEIESIVVNMEVRGKSIPARAKQAF